MQPIPSMRPDKSLPPHKAFLTLGAFHAPAGADHGSARDRARMYVRADERGGRLWRVTFALVMMGLLMVNFAVKLLDRGCKRSDECMDLQVRIADAWRQHAALAKLPIAAAVRRSWWRATIIIEVTGPVPGPVLHETALRITREEASRDEPSFKIRDKFQVGENTAARVA